MMKTLTFFEAQIRLEGSFWNTQWLKKLNLTALFPLLLVEGVWIKNRSN
jgi:hypothetical protein